MEKGMVEGLGSDHEAAGVAEVRGGGWTPPR